MFHHTYGKDWYRQSDVPVDPRRFYLPVVINNLFLIDISLDHRMREVDFCSSILHSMVFKSIDNLILSVFLVLLGFGQYAFVTLTNAPTQNML